MTSPPKMTARAPVSACQDRPELGALRSVGGRLDGIVGGQVSGADLDARREWSRTATCAARGPPAPGTAGCRLLTMAARVSTGVAEQPAAAGFDAGQPLAVVDDAGEAQVVPGLPRDPGGVTAAGLVEGDGVRPRLTNLGHRRLNPLRVVDPEVAARQAR